MLYIHETKFSFKDSPTKKSDPIVHLSSFLIEEGTVPGMWPLASILAPENSKRPMILSERHSSGNPVGERQKSVHPETAGGT